MRMRHVVGGLLICGMVGCAGPGRAVQSGMVEQNVEQQRAGFCRTLAVSVYQLGRERDMGYSKEAVTTYTLTWDSQHGVPVHATEVNLQLIETVYGTQSLSPHQIAQSVEWGCLHPAAGEAEKEEAARWLIK